MINGAGGRESDRHDSPAKPKVVVNQAVLVDSTQAVTDSMGYSSVVDTLAPRFPDLTEFFSTPVPLPETVMKARRLFEWFRDSAQLGEAY
jgi:hypothetical protein